MEVQRSFFSTRNGHISRQKTVQRNRPALYRQFTLGMKRDDLADSMNTDICPACPVERDVFPWNKTLKRLFHHRLDSALAMPLPLVAMKIRAIVLDSQLKRSQLSLANPARLTGLLRNDRHPELTLGDQRKLDNGRRIAAPLADLD